MTYKKSVKNLNVKSVKDGKLRKKIVSMPRIFDAGKSLDKPWHVEFSYRDPITDRMKRFRYKEGINQFKTVEERYKEALKVKRKYTRRLKNGWSPFAPEDKVYEDNLEYKAIVERYGRLKTSNKQLFQYMSDYLENFKPPLYKEKTFKGYQSKFRIFGNWLNSKKLSDIHPALFTEKEAKGFSTHLLKKRKAEAATYNKYIKVLKAFFEWLREKKVIASNPFDGIKSMKETRRIPQFYNETMTRVIMEHIGKKMPMLLLVMKFEYYTHIRPGALRFLQIKHINFWESTVLLSDKSAKNRLEDKVVIPKVFLDELLELGLNKLPRDYYVFTKDQIPGEKPVGQNYFANHYRKLVQEIGVPDDYKLYNWKHTGGAVAIQDNINLVDISRQMQHKHIETTQYYVDVLKRADKSDYYEGMRPMGEAGKSNNPNMD